MGVIVAVWVGVSVAGGMVGGADVAVETGSAAVDAGGGVSCAAAQLVCTKRNTSKIDRRTNVPFACLFTLHLPVLKRRFHLAVLPCQPIL